MGLEEEKARGKRWISNAEDNLCLGSEKMRDGMRKTLMGPRLTQGFSPIHDEVILNAVKIMYAV